MPLQQTFAAAFTSGIVLWWDKPWVRTDHIILHIWKQNNKNNEWHFVTIMITLINIIVAPVFFVTEGIISEDANEDDDDDE